MEAKKLPDLYENIPRSTLIAIAASAASRMVFIAKNRVDSEALFTLDRRICLPGDRIEVIKWLCFNGPTVIKVYSKELRKD